VVLSGPLFAQSGFSIVTDLTGQHNFKKGQEYTSIGQTLQALFHITAKDGIFISFSYYSNGHFKNDLVATARSGNTVPSQIRYVNSAKMRLKELSLGWRKYLVGNAETETGYNFYVYAGFGLELGRVINTHSVNIDTALYSLPVLPGTANFKRLTIDPGVGIEHYLLADFSAYAEFRAWIPTTDYPSKYIFVTDKAPFVGMLCVGLRIIF